MRFARTTTAFVLATAMMAGSLAKAPVAVADNGSQAQSNMQGGMNRERMQNMLESMSPEQRRQMMQSMQNRSGGQMGPGMLGSEQMGPGMMGQGGMMPGQLGPCMMGGMNMMRPMMGSGIMQGLSQQERAEFQELRQEMRRTHMEAMLDMMAVRDEMQEAMLEQRPDPKRIRQLHDRMAERHGEALEARIQLQNRMQDVMENVSDN
ncbi:periplasmic heavy metal sensor [Rhodovibrio sodomensis]|nr:periplasmic heavy metal sensor [Rhodovibrio sodomensis]